MDDETRRLIEAVQQMRAAQRLEWEALPRNLQVWKQSRMKQRVAELERQVDALLEACARREGGGPSR